MISTDYIMILLLVSSFVHEYCAFLPNVRIHSHDIVGKHRQETKYSSSSSNYDDKENHYPFSIQESTEMQQLILSLSLESSDQRRRDRLANLYDEEYSNPNLEMYQRFVLLFDRTLIEMGTVIQESARQEALKKPQGEQEVANGTDDYMSLNRSIEERQLWAMVDMMVQSKVLAKRKLAIKDDFQ